MFIIISVAKRWYTSSFLNFSHLYGHVLSTSDKYIFYHTGIRHPLIRF